MPPTRDEKLTGLIQTHAEELPEPLGGLDREQRGVAHWRDRAELLDTLTYLFPNKGGVRIDLDAIIRASETIAKETAMTLTPDQIAKYEARAAKGEKPKLPWEEREMFSVRAELEFASPGYSVEVSIMEARGWSKAGPNTPRFKTVAALRLYLEDRLRAFAAPLLDAPVEGPWVWR